MDFYNIVTQLGAGQGVKNVQNLHSLRTFNTIPCQTIVQSNVRRKGIGTILASPRFKVLKHITGWIDLRVGNLARHA